jgi:transcriptional regulator with XRE-family HTH domain
MTAMLVLDARQACTGAAIRYLRKQRGLSARALSIKAGLSPAYVFKVETGAIEPSLRTFARLAVALGMTMAEVWVCVVNETHE